MRWKTLAAYCLFAVTTDFLGVELLNAQNAVPRAPIVVSPQAVAIHRDAPVVDGHNDLPWALRSAGGRFDRFDIATAQPQFHTDIARLRKGGVGAQFWSVYVPVSTSRQGNALTVTLEQIEIVKEMVEQYSDVFELALSTADIKRIRQQGKIASMIGVEGGHSIENSINVLRQLYKDGARYMTLTHSISLDWADSCSDKPICGGLSPFGEEIVHEMNRLGMMVDISHVSADCMRHTLRVTRAPVIFSHSSARSIADHPRNVTDDVLKMLDDNGGVVMINFFNDFINSTDAERSRKKSELREELKTKFVDDSEQVDLELRKWELANPRSKLCTVHDVLDHIQHVIEVAGIEHVGIGSDFDGVPALPKQLEDVSMYPVITQGLLDRGYTESEIRQVLGENVIRVFQEVEAAAAEINDNAKP
jgi:membrane dipeptidase